MATLINVVSHACMITVFVFVMMIIDYLNVLTQGKMEALVKGGRWRQYLIASLLGSMPGCLGAFTLVGLIPESGPHLVFVMLFANGVVPFSILLTSSIVQDGHGMLPLFSYSLKHALLVKLFNLGFGMLIGLPLLLLGW